jgi:preprotein translocase subunit YajC
MFLAQSSTTAAGGGNALGLLLPLVLMGGVFYFLLIRPNKRRAQAQQQLQSSLSVGDEVMTTGGIYGTIEAIDEDDGVVTLEIAPNVRIRILQAGISRRVQDEYEDDDDEDDEHDQEDEHSS